MGIVDSAPSSEKPEDLYTYTGLRTPDGAYYVGIDMPSALHPQTILAYEMNGEPLPMNHGGPLRLIIPTKFPLEPNFAGQHLRSIPSRIRVCHQWSNTRP